MKMNMRRWFLISLLALVGMSFTGCVVNKPENTCYYHADPIYLEAKSSDWQYDEKNLQFYVHFDVPELTAKVYDFGNYSLHREYNTGTSNAYQVGLPQTIFMSEEVEYEDHTTGIVYYTQHVDYRVGVGYVEIQVTNSDFLYPQEESTGYLINPEAMTFHLQLIY